MCRVTISAHQLLEMFPNEEAARLHLEQKRWNGSPSCPKCQAETKQYKQKRYGKAGYYLCGACGKVYTVRTGTIFERSHVPLHKWLFAIFQLVTACKGLSSVQLSKEIGVTQKTAWFMLQRIRKAHKDDNGTGGITNKGIVEAYECYLGGT